MSHLSSQVVCQVVSSVASQSVSQVSQVSPAVVHVPGVLARGDEGREGVTCSECARERRRREGIK